MSPGFNPRQFQGKPEAERRMEHAWTLGKPFARDYGVVPKPTIFKSR